MLVVRAWPESIAPGYRPHVIDDWPRIPVRDFDYAPGLLGPGEDLIVLDWDVAVDLDDLQRFARNCEGRTSPLVGPNKLWGDPLPVWAFKRYVSEHAMRWCTTADASCHLFGFGFVFLPHALLKAWAAANPGEVLDDMTFSGWHHKHVAPETPIDWSVRSVHVHYPVPAGGRL